MISGGDTVTGGLHAERRQGVAIAHWFEVERDRADAVACRFDRPFDFLFTGRRLASLGQRTLGVVDVDADLDFFVVEMRRVVQRPFHHPVPARDEPIFGFGALLRHGTAR